MPFPLNVLPDDELAVLQYLRTVPEVVALCPAANIIQQLPPTAQQTFPYVLIQRLGGSHPVWQRLDEAGQQVDVLAATRGQAKRLMLTVRAAIMAIANDIVPEATLVSAAEEVGPSWLPDEITNPVTPRFTARYRVILHK